MHVDGEPVKSCNVFALDVDGAEVRTIEGMANADGSPRRHPGRVPDPSRPAVRFLHPGHGDERRRAARGKADPTEAEIREYLDGNICRCTGYHNIVKAIQAAAAELGATRVAAE